MVHFYLWASNEWVLWIVIKCSNSAWSSWKSHSTKIARIGMKRTSSRRRKTIQAHAYTVCEASGKSNMMWNDFILNDKTKQQKNSTSIAFVYGKPCDHLKYVEWREKKWEKIEDKTHLQQLWFLSTIFRCTHTRDKQTL